MQNTGDMATVTGYGLTLTGVGAEVGLPLAMGGNTLSFVGSVMEIGVNFLVEDSQEGIKNGAILVGGMIINEGLNKLLPGPTSNVVSEKTKEILKQGNAVKTMIIEKSAEKPVEKLIENKENKN